MTAAPWLTVAIPTYNGARHIRHALRSVLAQSERDFDLIVVDDRSDDETPAIIREIASDRARVEVNSERLGLAGNWNRCVELSRTPWVAIFHQDDLMKPGHLERHRACLTQHPDVGFVCGGFDILDAEGHSISHRIVERTDLGPSRLFGPGEFVAELRVRNPVRCSTVTLSRAAHESVGGFDPKWRYVVDWEFWFRVAQRHSVGWLRDISVSVRWHAESETHRFQRGTADIEEVETLLDRIWSSQAPDAVRTRVARAYLNRAYEAARAGDKQLAARALHRARQRDPGIAWTLARDPRLAIRLAPHLFRRPEGR